MVISFNFDFSMLVLENGKLKSVRIDNDDDSYYVTGLHMYDSSSILRL